MSAKDTETCSKLMRLEDLNVATLSAIFRCYYNEDDLKVVHLDKGEDDFSVGVNNQFNSTIIKWKVTLSGDRVVSFIVKESLDNNTFRRVMSKMMRMTMREYFWYVESMPTLGQFYPELKHIGPQCYHATTSYKRDYFPHNCLTIPLLGMCGLCVYKADVGMALLEDLSHENRTGGPMKVLNKAAIPTIQVAKVALAAMAQFHGTWWHWLNSPGDQQPCKIGDLDRTQVPKALDLKADVRGLKYTFTMTKSVEQQLRMQNKSEQMIAKWKTFRTTGYIDLGDKYMCNVSKAPSRMFTIIHGDFWTSNMMYNDAEDQVSLLDFQMLKWQHPAADLWYYLYSCTDSDWRQQHLDECLDTYFEIFSQYTRRLGWNLTRQEFLDEVNERRVLGLLFGMQLLPIILNPQEFDAFGTFAEMKQFYKWRDEALAAEAKEDDHPQLTELRRRIVDMAVEAIEIGFI